MSKTRRSRIPMSTGVIRESIEGELMFPMDDFFTREDDLLVAIQENNLTQVKLIYGEFVAFQINAQMLWAACEEDASLGLLKFLLENKKSQISQDAFDKVLLLAIKNKKIEQIEYLIESRKVNLHALIEDENGCSLTFLQHAVKTNCRDTVLALFEQVTELTKQEIQNAYQVIYQAFLLDIKKIKNKDLQAFYQRMQNPRDGIIDLSGLMITYKQLNQILKFFMSIFDGQYMGSDQKPHTLNLSGINLSGIFEMAELKSFIESNIDIRTLILNDTGLTEYSFAELLEELNLAEPHHLTRIIWGKDIFHIGSHPSPNVSCHTAELRSNKSL